MEPITNLKPEDKRNLTSFKSALVMYKFVYDYVTKYRIQEFNSFLSTCLSRNRDGFSEADFMVEYVWCVHVAGMSASVIGKKFPGLVRVHNIIDATDDYWHVNDYITITEDNIVNDLSEVLKYFNNPRKASAVQKVRKLILDLGWDKFKETYLKDLDVNLIQKLPFMGPALSRHLARNLGNMNVCKPDVHLLRLAKHYKYDDVESLCKDVSTKPIGYTDLMLWIASVDHGTKI